MPREYPAPDFEVEDLEAFAVSKGYSDEEEYTLEEKQLMLDFLAHHKLNEICILK